MGIYIPNMEKPKDCEVCPFSILDGAVTDDNKWVSYSFCDLLGKTIGDADMMNDCPLIEIVRCGECTHHDDGLCHRPKWSFAVEPMDFCSYGERRAEQSQINTIENTSEERVKMHCNDMRISTDERERK